MERNELFRVKLQNELVTRIKKNSKFSLRSFAKQLNLEASSLSKILSGKRKLTDKMCIRLGKLLSLSEKETLDLMNMESQSKSAKKDKLLNDDAFKCISDWHHFAILELTRVKNFKSNMRWIAKVLNISHGEAQEAVERLKRLNYLAVDKNGKFSDALGLAYNEGNEYSTIAFRKLQKQILSKASEALDNIDYSQRVQSSMTFAIKKDKLPEAKRRILNLIDELNDFLGEGQNLDEVYHLGVSLYPVSNT